MDGVVVNHGTLGAVQKVGEGGVEEWRRGFEVNVFSVVGLVSLFFVVVFVFGSVSCFVFVRVASLLLHFFVTQFFTFLVSYPAWTRAHILVPSSITFTRISTFKAHLFSFFFTYTTFPPTNLPKDPSLPPLPPLHPRPHSPRLLRRLHLRLPRYLPLPTSPTPPFSIPNSLQAGAPTAPAKPCSTTSP